MKSTHVAVFVLVHYQFQNAEQVEVVADYLALLEQDSLCFLLLLLSHPVEVLGGLLCKVVRAPTLDFGEQKVFVLSKCLFDHHAKRRPVD